MRCNLSQETNRDKTVSSLFTAYMTIVLAAPEVCTKKEMTSAKMHVTESDWLASAAAFADTRTFAALLVRTTHQAEPQAKNLTAEACLGPLGIGAGPRLSRARTHNMTTAEQTGQETTLWSDKGGTSSGGKP